MSTLQNFMRWLVRKIVASGLILALGLVAGALWMFLRDDIDFDAWRGDALRTLTAERVQTLRRLNDLRTRLEGIKNETAAEQAKAATADGVIAQLKELDSTWDRLVGNSDQQKANAEQKARMQALRIEALARAEKAKQEFTRTTWERDGLEISLAKISSQLKAAEAEKSKSRHYLEKFWHDRFGKIEVKIWVLTSLGLYFLGTTAARLGLYFSFAPRISLGRPVRLSTVQTVLPELGPKSASVEVALGSGERLRVKEKYLPELDETVVDKARFFLDWRIPLTCLATGLTHLGEIAARGGGGGCRLTLSDRSDPQNELIVITLPAGASFILRPSFLAGVVVPAGKLKLRRRWQLLRWQAWVTKQFRFFEFIGPCRLIVAASHGIRTEFLTGNEDDLSPSGRVDRGTTIGFTSGLDYRPVRTKGFWSYHRGVNPLFQDHFAGQGVFLVHKISSAGQESLLRQFWNGLLKLFGL